MSGKVANVNSPVKRETVRVRDVRKLKLLLEAINELSGEIELELLLRRAMDLSTRIVDADRSSLFIYDRV